MADISTAKLVDMLVEASHKIHDPSSSSHQIGPYDLVQMLQFSDFFFIQLFLNCSPIEHKQIVSDKFRVSIENLPNKIC